MKQIDSGLVLLGYLTSFDIKLEDQVLMNQAQQNTITHHVT